MTNPFPAWQPLVKTVLSVTIKELDTVTVQFTDQSNHLCTLTGPRDNAHIIAIMQRFKREQAASSAPYYQSPVQRRVGISEEIEKFLGRARERLAVAPLDAKSASAALSWLGALNATELKRDVESLEMIREKVETENPL